MIRVSRPKNAPPILRDPDKRGQKATRELCSDYDDGVRAFEFDRTIYAAKSVKNALIKAQHHKCCFCEAKVTHIAYGDVEHLRPKGGYRQSPEDELHKPGYYWLAYAWTNLSFCCQLCNQRFKKNLFPLKVPDQRAESHHDDVEAEQPLFIDPCADDPAEYIGFRQEYPYAIDGNLRGQQTILALGLGREELAEMRRDRLKGVTLSMETIEHFQAERQGGRALTPREGVLLEKHRARVNEMQQDDAEYAAMARAAITDHA